MVFITEGFFEVATESWPEWDIYNIYIHTTQTHYMFMYHNYQVNDVTVTLLTILTY